MTLPARRFLWPSTARLASWLPHRPAPIIEATVAPALIRCCSAVKSAVLEEFGTPESGLTEEEAARRLVQDGPNEIATQEEPHLARSTASRAAQSARRPPRVPAAHLPHRRHARGHRHGHDGCARGRAPIRARGARGRGGSELRAMIRVTATAIRDGIAREVPLREIVPGDLVALSAGDMVPADVRLLSAKDLYVSQASLTGESLPAEKGATDNAPTETGRWATRSLTQNLCFLGTSVQSGTATAVVVETGGRTFFGSMARTAAERPSRPRSTVGSIIHLAHDPLHGRYGPARLRDQWRHQA